MNAKAVPGAGDEERAARLLQKWPSTGLPSPEDPPPIIGHPAASTNLVEKRVDERLVRSARATEVDRRGEQARPVLDRGVAEHCCMLRVPTKMKAKKLPPSRRPAALAPASVRSRKMRSGSSGARRSSRS